MLYQKPYTYIIILILSIKQTDRLETDQDIKPLSINNELDVKILNFEELYQDLLFKIDIFIKKIKLKTEFLDLDRAQMKKYYRKFIETSNDSRVIKRLCSDLYFRYIQRRNLLIAASKSANEYMEYYISMKLAELNSCELKYKNLNRVNVNNWLCDILIGEYDIDVLTFK